MEIKITAMKGRVPVQVMHLHGDLNSSTYEAFQSKANELIKNGTQYILIDLTHTPFISSAGLRAIHSIYNQLRAAKPDRNDEEIRKGISAGTYRSPYIKLLNLSSDAEKAFSLGGFDMYIETHTDLLKAVSSF
ncbi:MAG: STAS domain-containing protein [Anaerolineales bacterium]|jgi:anti-anti-sigma factor|uniref:STAS domain-containing protein n=1 Tax=Candidatus Villigracilis affinis TaxID=3140682 RepID=UPI001B4055AE|nr:STAS domain-containing protein [Anaerolineales bacterium]MBK9600678.1 STAS domain-containing protein [Anaerolineales bacterium]MBL0344626.1 STAS domain-containing protein [Anaerolineales bacterium]MBP8048539.1 STAS domain-containing protein [Anaerolineales bacterium]